LITEKLANYVAGIKSLDIPDRAIEVARSAITDFVGVTFAGSKDESGRIITQFAKSMGGQGPCAVIGGGFRTSPYLASLANGTMGHALDFDDGGSFGHSSVVLAPTVLALGESLGTSGRDVIAAYIVGFEAVLPVHSTVGSVHYGRGFHGSATTGSLAAALSASWLLKLNAHQVRMALGIAASLAGGLRQNFGTMTKPLHAGNAASNGIKAALLAHAGFTADENIIEAPLGFAKVLGFEAEVDWAKVSEGLGRSFSIIAPGSGGIHYKLYPSCAETTTSIDAAVAIFECYHPDLEEISEVQLGVNGTEGAVLIHHRPRTGLEGKFSLEYTVARALISGKLKVEHFSEAAVNEPRVKALIEKMRWVEKYPQPKPGSRKTFGPNSVTVKLKNGQEFYQEMLSPKGSRQNPFSKEDLQAKYRDCASMVLPTSDVSASLDILNNLEKQLNIHPLMDILVKN
jgi:2-methylcitrate dehydratase PrpD